MKKVLVLISLATLLTYCGPPKNTGSGSSSSSVHAKHGSATNAEDDNVKVTGTEYVPVHGQFASGTRRDLEGSWVLESAPGTTIDNKPNLTADPVIKSTPVIEKRDSTVTTKKVGNVTHTITEVNIQKTGGQQENKITPEQMANPNVHQPEKPSLSFYGSNGTFSGFTGCNKISGRYNLSANKISFDKSAPSTKMVCIGEYNENAFLEALHKVNSYRAADGKLELMDGDSVLLVFVRK